MIEVRHEQLRDYSTKGFLLFPEVFSGAEVEAMKRELLAIFGEETERRVLEKQGAVVRSVYGSHTTNKVFYRLVRHPKLLGPARQILRSEVYVYQFKINAKAPFGGDLWDWHQDYVFWLNEDGLRTPRVISVAIFLDEVTEFNGPMFLIPGSHSEGAINTSPRDEATEKVSQSETYADSPAWISNLTADLKYSLDRDLVAKLTRKHGMVSAKGPAGSALFFDGNIVHASTNNISPFGRAVVIITFNSVENIPRPGPSPRPDFLVSRDYTPLVPLTGDTLL